MDVTYNWSVQSMICSPLVGDNSNVVTVVQWTASATAVDNGVTYESSISGAKSIKYDNTSTFVPYDQLTEQQVLAWVWEPEVVLSPVPTNPNRPARPPVDIKARTESMLLDRINKQITPTQVVLGLPWSGN